jgi:hypothetical protein
MQVIPLTFAAQQAGDTFVVADCGGGTADIISYEVVTISPMVVKECVKGQGAYWNHASSYRRVNWLTLI